MSTAGQRAEDQRISREVISFGETKDGKYRAFIKTCGFVGVGQENMMDCDIRTETSFYYIPSAGLSEETAIAILITMATYAFLNTDYQEIGIKCIEELTNGKKKPAKTTKAPAKEKPAAEAKEETAPEPVAEVKQEEKKAAPAAKKTTKKAVTKKPKTIAYSRENNEHKKQFGSLLNDADPTWPEDEGKLKIAQGLSIALAGKPFLDTKGEVLESVIEMISDAFSKPAGLDAL